MNQEKYLSLLRQAGCSEDVIAHSKKVYGIATKIVKKLEENGEPVDRELVSIGALLHDIGRGRTHGIRHAIEGAKIAQTLGLSNELVSLIEHHIGAGIEKEEAAALGLPPKDYIPETLEEEIVAHADNLVDGMTLDMLVQEFIDKGHIRGAERLKHLHRKLELKCKTDLGELLWSKSG